MKIASLWIGIVAVCIAIACCALYYKRVLLPRHLVNNLRGATQRVDEARCRYLAQRIVLLGTDAIPPLIDELLTTDFGVVEPSPCDLLRSFPEASHKALLERLTVLNASMPVAGFTDDVAAGKFYTNRSNLIYALIYVADDWTYFDIWLTDTGTPRRGVWNNFEGTVKVFDAKLSQFSAPALLAPDRPQLSCQLNSRFLEWWSVHKHEVMKHSP
jgi:hypothetical protein